jgi:hypothetical protein
MKVLRGKILHHDDEFGISFEDKFGFAFCHCEIYKCAPSVLKRCRDKIRSLQIEHRRDAYGVSKLDDEKHKRFLKIMGFTHYKNSWIVDENDEDHLISIYIKEYALC